MHALRPAARRAAQAAASSSRGAAAAATQAAHMPVSSLPAFTSPSSLSSCTRRPYTSSRAHSSEAEAAPAAPAAAVAEAAYVRPKVRPTPIPLHKLHANTHRLPREKAAVPAFLSPDEQGSGEQFIPTLLRPAEWIRPTQPVLPTPLPWHAGARRTGILGTKLGMLQVWDHHGVRLPITVVKVDSQVVGVNNVLAPRRRTLGLQIGIGARKLKNTTKAMMVHFAKAGVAPKRRIVEFPVTPDAVLPVGWQLSARHFVPGQFVDVTGTSIGKGFQGGMKKWGFGGMNASHGVSVVHRSLGSTGGRQDPGKVFRNKKMPGRMGGKRVTKQNNKLWKVDVKNNLLYIVGTLPGNKGQYVMVRDAAKRPWHPDTPPPFPTFDTHQPDDGVQEIICAPEEEDPFAFGVA